MFKRPLSKDCKPSCRFVANSTVSTLTVSRMEITFSLLAQTVIACLLVTVAVVCYVYGDEDSGGGDTEADREAGD